MIGRRHRPIRGLSLVETLVAAFLLFITFMAVLNVLPASLVSQKRALQRTQADALARGEVETARAASFASLAAGIVAEKDQPVNETVFHVSRTVTQLFVYLKQVDVTVSWDEPGWTRNSRRSFSLRALVARVNR